MKASAFLPLAVTDTHLEIAIVNPDDFETIDALALASGLEIWVRQGRAEDILEAIERLYGAGSQSIENIIEEAKQDIVQSLSQAEENAEQLRDMASEAPIIRLVNRLVLNAVESRASDIHFEPYENEFKVRYRIDGELNDVESPPKRFQAAIISRVKIMAKLDISERRLPQDGRIKLKIADKEIDFRVSTIPTLFGESLVMRILDREALVLDLNRLGFPERLLERYLKLIHQPHGMVLVTGPTGSGKTSTLYATLSLINSPENKIITLEDPVEYQLKGVNQIQVNPKIGLTFASGLRSIVRQDPDVILLGEIRDRETAETAVQSALTGHLLFSTLHTNDSAGALTRLLDMGVESFLLSSTLLGVLAQRLVRVICPHCKTATIPEDAPWDDMRIPKNERYRTLFYKGEGCEVCRYSGFHGRTAIFEYLPVTDAIRKEINARAGTERIRHVAVNQGMATLRQDGWEKVKAGVTTVSEVLRVTLEE
jgi:general secretion pathway protein E